jgi:2-hydroxychromene-2-carboxylate isomerase
MALQVDYYFAPASPWAYLGHSRFDHLVKKFDISVSVRPVDLAQKVFPVSGGVPLENRSPQRLAYRQSELRRFSRHLGLPLNPNPRYFPVDPDRASRLIIMTERLDGQDAAMRLTSAIMRAVWAEEFNIADLEVLGRLLAKCNLPPNRLEGAMAAEAALQFERNANLANEAGVFGAPSYLFRGELFWGQDRIDFLERALIFARGEDAT